MGAVREKRVKSASRVLEILEAFDHPQRSMSVMDVARRLNYPQSSTTELLTCLVAEGYLIRDRDNRTYRPSARVTLLGAWVQPTLFRNGRLLSIMDALANRTGGAVVLATQVGVRLQHLHVVGEVPAALATASDHHLLHSPLGWSLLETMGSEKLRQLVHRLNATSDAGQRVLLADIAELSQQARLRGHVVGGVGEGYAAVSILLPQRLHDEQFSLGVMMPEDDMSACSERLCREVRRDLGLDQESPVRLVEAAPPPAYMTNAPARHEAGRRASV